MDGLKRVRTALARLMFVGDPDDVGLIRGKIEAMGEPRREFQRRMRDAYQALIDTWDFPKEGL